MRKKYNNTTITLSIPKGIKEFLDKLAQDGYNRSNLMLKLIYIMHMLYNDYSQIPLPRAIECIHEWVREGELLKHYNSKAKAPRESDME